MSRSTCMSLAHEHNVLKTSKDQERCKSKSSCHTAGPGCMKTSAHCNSPHKVKRLKTRKERNQIRGQVGNRSHTCPQHSRKVGSEKAQHHGCHRSHSVLSSRKKEKTFAKPFSPLRPSVITEGRLTSIRGLFSHEVRSLDIERLVSEQIKKEKQRRQSMMHITSLSPPDMPSVPDSDQDCTLNEVQEPVQEPENNTLAYLRTNKGLRKELRGKYPHANKGVTVPEESSREDEKHDRSANTRKEDINNKSRPDSLSRPKGTELMIVSSPENILEHHLCSTPVEANKKYSGISETDSPKSHNKSKSDNRTSTSNKENCFMNIQRLETMSTMAGFPNMEVEQNKIDPSLSELGSGSGTLTDNVKQGKKISVSVREAVKRLSTRLCQTVELRVPSGQRPLLAGCREVLLQTLQKRHGVHLQHNLNKLHPLLNRKQTATFGSGQTHKDCSQIHFSHAIGNKDIEHRRNMEIWTDNVMQQDYLSEEFKQNSARGASMKKRRVQAGKTSPPPVSLIQPQQSHTDLSLQLDQPRTARLSQDCFRSQHYPRTTVFQQDQALSKPAAPILSAPSWAAHLYEPFSQQLLGYPQRRGESVTNLDLELISHQWKENTDPALNLYQEYQNKKQKTPEAFLAESSICSNQLQIQDVRERWAPLSISASFPLEGFQYKPFFRFPHPSNSLYRSDWLGMDLSPKLNTPDGAFYHHWG